jgi:tetratricopeptide (TPR) repeat protein
VPPEATTPAKIAAALPWLLLALVFAGAAAWRSQLARSAPGYNPEDDTAIYWTENAFHYRYARAIARAEPIPRVDPMVQAPTGLDLKRHISLFMEYVAGCGFRALGGDSFPRFLTGLIGLTCALGVLAIFGVALALWRRPWPALFAASLYAVAIPSFVRLRESYAREHLGLPLIFISLALLLGALRSSQRARVGLALGSGVVLALGCLSWHLTRSYLLVLAVAIAVTWALQLLRSPQQAEELARVLLWVAAPVLLVGLGSEMLRARVFFLHPGLWLLILIPIVHAIPRLHTPQRKLIGLGGGLILVLILKSLLPSEDDSHVWALLAAKLANLGIKPADPGALSWEARFLWVEAFNSPDLLTFFYGYGSLPILAIVGLAISAKPAWKTLDAPQLIVFALTLLFLALCLLVQRMTGFVVFFVCLLSAPLVLNCELRKWALPLALICLVFETHKFLYYGEATTFKRLADRWFGKVELRGPQLPDDNRTMLAWLYHYTEPDDIVLARMGTSPVILTWSERPVVLQSKAENADLRARVRGYLEALYGSEGALAEYCARYQVRYLVHEAASALDTSPDSDRYMGDALQLRRDSAAYKLHFAPQSLSHFRLVFQNPSYRIFAIPANGAKVEAGVLPPQPIFDLAQFGPQSGEFFDDSHTPELWRKLQAAVALYRRGDQRWRDGELGSAIEDLQKAAELQPGMVGVHATLAMALADARQIDRAIAAAQIEPRYYPAHGLSHFAIGYVAGITGNLKGARDAWNAAMQLEPKNRERAEKLRQLEALITQ